MKTVLVLTAAIVTNALGNVCLSKGMRGFEASEGSGSGGFAQLVWHAASEPWVILGVLLLVIFLACYLAALSWADLSFVLPATAPGYILTAILSSIFLQETISPARWAGTFLIVAGTWLVARTYTERTAPAPGVAPAAPSVPLARQVAESGTADSGGASS